MYRVIDDEHRVDHVKFNEEIMDYLTKLDLDQKNKVLEYIKDLTKLSHNDRNLFISDYSSLVKRTGYCLVGIDGDACTSLARVEGAKVSEIDGKIKGNLNNSSMSDTFIFAYEDSITKETVVQIKEGPFLDLTNQF